MPPDQPINFEKDAQALVESAILSNLKLSPEERIEAHENALKLVLDLQSIGEAMRAESKEPAQNPS